MPRPRLTPAQITELENKGCKVERVTYMAGESTTTSTLPLGTLTLPEGFKISE